MLAGLIDDRRGQKLRQVELTHGEAIEPRYLATCEARQLSSVAIPQPDVHAIRPAPAEQKNRHVRQAYNAKAKI